MNKTTKKILSVLFAIVLFMSAFPVMGASAATVANVGSLWDGFTSGTGTFTVTASSRVYVVGNSAPTGDLLQTVQLIQRQLRDDFESLGAFSQLVWGPAEWAETGDIVLNLDKTSGTGADGYKLDVTATTATVTAADTDGLIYGANNLMKCFRAVGGNSISGFSGNDTPDTKQRVVMLDTGRKYYTVEWICNFIRQMSWMGYNAIEIHFSEDGGFRADLWDPAYYKGQFQPENDFSWLCGSYVQSWVKDPYRTDPDAGKYLTTAELVQICEVAKEYHIEVIPSFDSPAHMDYITWKFEQNYKSNKNYFFTYGGEDEKYEASITNGCINYTGTTGASSPTWPYYTTIDITEDTVARAFVFALYEDMADFFKEYAGSTNFNIGADEVNLSSSYGPNWSYSQFPGYINSLNRMLNDKGYTVRMFNDFIGSTTYNQSGSKAVYTFDSNIEICYWNSDFNPSTGKWTDPIWHVKFFWENNTGSTDNWGDGGRTMYNCIQTNTYYVLREGTSGDNHRDARDPDNRNWTFYGTNEMDIYNKWYPADISEKGVYTENAADVPADQLGGAYFLVWNDYAALSSESEVWNGALDCWDKDRTYYIFDIMASNIIKMWNSDINNTVTYNEFATVRDAVNEDFPGFTSCSAKASLPAATTPVKAANVDKTALQAAVDAAPTAQGSYTDTTWAAFQTALTAAKAVLDNADATQEQVDAALAALNNAVAALVSVDKSALRAAVNAAPTDAASYTSGSWTAFQTALTNAKAVLNDGDATQTAVDDALTALNNAKNALVSISVLKAAVDSAVNEQGNYTDDTWAAYEAALEEAEDVLAKPDATQKEVDAAVAALAAAKAALKVDNGPEILEIRKLSKTAVKGKKIGLVINTTTDAKEVTVSLDGAPVTLTKYLTNVQTISGEQVRVWMINFSANETGTFDYVVSITGGESETVTITVK